MNPRILTLAALALGTVAVHAEDAAPAGAPAQPYQLQRKSVFTATDEDQRAPFWPIGWVKQKAGPNPVAAVPAGPRVKLDESAFKVTSILLGNPSLAIINGRTYSEGEFLRQPRAVGGAATVATSPIPAGARIRVYRIDDGGIVLQYQEQLLTVMLKRPELAERRADEQLLIEDRP
jgi:hypothetical protein